MQPVIGKSLVPIHCVACDVATAAQTGRGAPYLKTTLVGHGWVCEAEAEIGPSVAAIRALVLGIVERGDVDVLLLSGGSGIGPADRTPDAVVPLFSRRLPGFGERYRQLAQVTVGAMAAMSRADAGIIAHTLVLLLPGSQAGCSLAMDALILPLLAAAVPELRRRRYAAAPPLAFVPTS